MKMLDILRANKFARLGTHRCVIGTFNKNHLDELQSKTVKNVIFWKQN